MLARTPGEFDVPILLRVFGPAEPTARAELERKMKQDRVPIKKQGYAAPKKATAPTPSDRSKMGYQGSQSSGSSSQSEIPELAIQDFIEGAERFRPRDVEEMVEQWGVPEESLSQLPMADQPDALKATLLPYQRQGLQWMLEQENPVLPAQGSKDVVQLWKRSAERQNVFQNIATQFHTSTAPTLAKGGILADDMGLGKTLQVISVILKGGPGTTLIIAPVSVMSNWAQQMERHVKEEHRLKVLTYHGSTRKRMKQLEFGEYDVIITSYGTLSQEFMPSGAKDPEKIPRKEGLFSMSWARVVLDEGHTIRNPSTKAAVAASSLLATSRWVLTGMMTET